LSINLRGREWTNPHGEVKVFNTLQCWKVTSDVTYQQEEEEAPKKKAGNIEKNFQEDFTNSLGGDLPF
jgi:hypothetical protein